MESFTAPTRTRAKNKSSGWHRSQLESPRRNWRLLMRFCRKPFLSCSKLRIANYAVGCQKPKPAPAGWMGRRSFVAAVVALTCCAGCAIRPVSPAAQASEILCAALKGATRLRWQGVGGPGERYCQISRVEQQFSLERDLVANHCSAARVVRSSSTA